MSFAVVWHGISSVLTLCLVVMAGYILARKNWFGPDSRVLLPRLVTLVALPAYMLHNILNSFTREELLQLLYGAVVPFVSIVLTLILGQMLVRLLRVSKGRRGICSCGISFSNTIFIGLPVNLALFGEEAVPCLLLYYFSNTLFFWSVGTYLLSVDGKSGGAPILSLATVKQVFSPPLLAFFVAVIMVLLGFKLPHFAMESARYLGNMTTPIILICLGITFQSMGLRSIKFNRELLLILVGRVILSPLVVLLVASFVPIPELMFKVFVVQSSLPTNASLGIVASYYKTDEEFATTAVLSTTLISIVTIPLFMVLLSL